EHHFAFIMVAGEVCSGELVQQLRDKLNIDKLLNIYGPTEAAICLLVCIKEPLRPFFLRTWY
ncbi:hypothetical protein, partial [Paenibacillus sp. OT2-17]|uniref:hypothetical protein n=1 Tax=Paenibacillus sp. OT2-17 TaxID=2691605 RepID=UPI001F19B5AB